jgi:hypothetical protein
LVDKAAPNRVIYRYQLKKKAQILNDDGVIILERDPYSTPGNPKTRYFELDFYNADWGILPSGRIWQENAEGLYLSDLTFKYKAEHPDWSYEKIQQESKKTLKKYSIDKVLEKKYKPIDL